MDKKITTVKEYNGFVRLFDQLGNYMFTKNGQMASYTESSISMKAANGKVQVFDNRNNYKFTR